MKDLINKNIGEIVAEDYRAAEIFEKYNIDFCCNGKRTMLEIQKNPGINFDKLIEELETSITRDNSENENYHLWPLDKLADHIVEKHHAYVQESIVVIGEYLTRICEVHGQRHPELLEISKLFNISSGELTSHMKKEEFILFPFIRQMTEVQKHGFGLDRPYFQSVENPVRMMMDEHDTEGSRFHEIKRLSNHFTVPEDGCNTYRVTYSLLKEFEEDLHLHIHLENNILFPKAIQMEKELFNE